MAREFHDTLTWKRAHLHPSDPDFVEVDLEEARDRFEAAHNYREDYL